MIYVRIGTDYICEYYCILYKRVKQSMDFGICGSPGLHPSWIPKDDAIREEWMASKNNQPGYNKSNTDNPYMHTHWQWNIREVKKTIPFTIATKRIKYLGINHLKRQKTRMQKTVSHWWRRSKSTPTDGETPGSWSGRTSIGKMTTRPKAVYRVSAVPIKLPVVFFRKLEQKDGWMASPTQWTWVWVNSGSCWWTGRPGVLQTMGSQRVRHDWVTELGTKKFTIWMETQKMLNSQRNLDKEKQSWRNQPSWLQTRLQSHSHQDRTARAQKQKHRPMEPDGKPRGKLTHLWAPYLWWRRQEHTMKKRQPPQKVVLGILDSCG